MFHKTSIYKWLFGVPGIYIYISHLLMAGVNVLHIILYMYIPLVDGKACRFSITTSPENYTMFICNKDY